MSRSKTDSTRVNIYIPNKVLAITRRMADRRGVTYSEVVRNALHQYLKQELESEKVQVGAE